MSVPVKEILRRAHQGMVNRESEWPEAEADAISLYLLCTRLLNQVRHLNEDRRIPAIQEVMDLCPVCAGSTWGRPQNPNAVNGGDSRDYSQRQCSDCGEIRPDPEDGRA